MINPAMRMQRALETVGDRVLLHDAHGHRVTGAELANAVARLAGLLPTTGEPRVGIWMRNAIEAFEAFLAVEWIAATRVPVDPDAAPAEAAAVFEAAGCDMVIVDPEHATGLSHLQPPECRLIVHGPGQPSAGAPRDPLPDVPADRTLHWYPRGAVGGQLLAVPITYAGWDWMIELNARLYEDGTYGPPADAPVFLTVQQLMHGTSMLGSFSFLRRGWPQVVMGSFDPQEVLTLADRHNVTSTMVVTGMLPALAEAARGGVTPTLRHVLYGGAPIAVNQLRQAVEALPDRLVQVFGRLEGGWPISVLQARDHADIAAGKLDRAASCGRPVPDIEIDLRPLPHQPAGELRVRSPAVSPAYADPDGWCGLGDLAQRDEDGYLYLLGRDDDMINTGYHIYPAEVAEVLRRVPGVTAAEVFGAPDPACGQQVVARITLEADKDEQAVRSAVTAELNHSLARYKHPRRIEIATTRT